MIKQCRKPIATDFDSLESSWFLESSRVQSVFLSDPRRDKNIKGITVQCLHFGLNNKHSRAIYSPRAQALFIISVASEQV